MAHTRFLKDQGVALLATAIALACRMALDPLLGDYLPYVTFFIAIAFTTWYAGLAAALTATLLGSLASVWFFIPPRFSLSVSELSHQVGLTTYIAVGLTFVAFGQVMRRARQRAEELARGLRATEERLTLAQQASQIGSFDWNLETGVNTWSPELYAIYGVRPDEFGNTQEAWERYLHPDDRGEMIRAVERSRTSGGAEEREFRIVRPDGEIRWLVGRWRWMRDRAGQPVRLTGVNFDITERKRNQEALRHSEAELAEFFEHASFGIHWVGPDGIILRVNQTELDLLGYSREEYLGHHIAEFHVDEPVINDMLQRLARGEALREYPARLRCKDRSIRDVLLNSNVRFEDGRFIHTRCFTRDVTDRKRAEEELRESEARTRAIFESALDALITMDADGRVRDFNPAAERMFGYSHSQAVGRTVADLIIPPQLREPHRKGLRRYLETGETAVLGRRIQLPALRADGTEIPVEFSIVVTRRPGLPPFFTAYLRDVSDRFLAERATAHLASIVRSSDDAIVSKDLRGIVTTWNQGAERLFGYQADEMIGQPVLKLIPPDRHNEEELILGKVSRGEVVETYETIRRRKDGTDVHVSLTVSPLLDGQGRVIGASKIARDITERKRVDAVLRDRDRALTAANAELNQQKAGLTEANKELQSFSYSVSHDLRAPLRTIDAYVRIVEEDHGPDLNDAVRRCLGIVKKAAGQAGELIDDLLEFSRLGRIGMDFRPTKMTELARDAADELALTQVGPAVDLTISELPLCQGDWRLLRLVWANLLANALKFTRGRPVAQIEVGWLPDDRRTDSLVYYVKDNGVGFDMKYVHKLFGVFQRLHLKEEFEGTGVGLAIVHRIVQRHGGRVWAEGKLDGGATFYFSVRKAVQ